MTCSNEDKDYIKNLFKELNAMTVDQLITRGRNRSDAKQRLEAAKSENWIRYLAEFSKKESQLIWDDLLALYGIPEDQEDLTDLEIKCCFKGYAPPHFHYLSECRLCGWVLTPYPDIKELESCHWCQSGYTQQMKMDFDKENA